MPEARHSLLQLPPEIAYRILELEILATEPEAIIDELLKAYQKLEQEFKNYRAMYGPAPKWVSNSVPRRKLR